MRIVVLISGSGSNLQALLDACAKGEIQAAIVGVISNKPNVKGLARATQAGVATQVLQHQDYASREAFDQKLQQAIDAYEADLVVLAGFMRILTPAFVDHYAGRLINIHPSLLPKFTGLHTHQRAIDEGATEHGASVHFVTSELDGGPVIIQGKVPVLPEDTAESLAQRVLVQEHIIYPRAVQWFVTGALQLTDGRCYLNGAKLPVQGVQV